MPRKVLKQERRRQLLDAARAVFVEKGFQAATVDDIVAQVDVARGTFYLYFADKRAVFEALIDEFLTGIVGCVRSIDVSPGADPPAVQLRANLHRVISAAVSEPTIVKLAFFDATGLDPELDAKLRTYYGALRTLVDESLEQGQALGLVRDGDRRVMAAIGLGGLKEMLVEAVSDPSMADADALTDEVMRFLSQGLLRV